jgi:hypothetical protein
MGTKDVADVAHAFLYEKGADTVISTRIDTHRASAVDTLVHTAVIATSPSLRFAAACQDWIVTGLRRSRPCLPIPSIRARGTKDDLAATLP